MLGRMRGNESLLQLVRVTCPLSGSCTRSVVQPRKQIAAVLRKTMAARMFHSWSLKVLRPSVVKERNSKPGRVLVTTSKSSAFPGSCCA